MFSNTSELTDEVYVHPNTSLHSSSDIANLDISCTPLHWWLLRKGIISGYDAG
jgi:hypothetical protein